MVPHWIRALVREAFVIITTMSDGCNIFLNNFCVEQKVSTKIRDEIEKNWRLILHDDTIHTIQQVCDIVSSACPLCPGPRAYEVTMEVHMTGAGTICVANKKLVSEVRISPIHSFWVSFSYSITLIQYTRILQSAGLTVSMAPDDDFESSQT